MKLYRFLTGPDDASFCHKVTDALNKGWSLQGSPTYAFNAQTGAMQCGQAVVKRTMISGSNSRSSEWTVAWCHFRSPGDGIEMEQSSGIFEKRLDPLQRSVASSALASMRSISSSLRPKWWPISWMRT